MYLVINCSHCDQRFQIRESSLGKTVECPHCRRATLAQRSQQLILPVARELPPDDAPLSLDDAPSRDAPLPECAARAERPRAKSGSRSNLSTLGLSILLTALVIALIYGGYHFWQQNRDPLSWETFAPSGGRASVLMPGKPREEIIPEEGYANRGGKRFSTQWKVTTKKDRKETTRTASVSFGWVDLEADRLVGVQFDQIATPIRERELRRLRGTLKQENSVGFAVGSEKYEANEYWIETDEGMAVMQVYLRAGEPRERVYVLIVNAPDIDPKTEWVRRFFSSFVPEKRPPRIT